MKNINIKVKCKNCGWIGQAVVGRKGFPLEKYKCPVYGQGLKRDKGSYDYDSEKAKLIGKFWP